MSERDPRALDALLDSLLDAEGVSPAVSRSIPRRGATTAPLSPSQRRLWFLEELEGEANAYTIAGAFVLRGTLDAAAIEAALGGVVDRHEALRTTFEPRDGDPVQVIHAAMPVPLERTDGDASRPEAEAARIAAEIARRPWDLSRGPLLRAALAALGPDTHALAVAMHHIVADGGSIGILLRDIAAFYDARRAGHAPDLGPLPIQQADHAAWQIERLASGDLAPRIEFWKNALGEAAAPLDLPSDRTRAALPRRRGATIRFVVEGETAAGLLRAARAAGATPYAAWLACFEALLARFGNRPDFTVGTPVAGRAEPETANLIGLFVNTLPVRADLSGDPTLRDMVARARDASRAALANADVPFDAIVETAGAPRLQGVTPLFQVMFAYQEDPASPIALPGIAAAMVNVDDGTAKFDLTLSIDRRGERFEGALEYDVDLFDRDTAARLVAQLERVAAALAAGGETRLSNLDLLGDDERAFVITGANATDRPFDRAATIPSLFEAQVRRTPGARAVVAPDGCATYAELDARAERLARVLRAEGVRPETLVGVCLSRRLDMIAALLAVLKAGGAYVPLDPAYPAERLAFMLEDSRCRVLVTETQLAAALPATRARTLFVDRLDATGGPDSGERAGAANLSHVIYTSGSTGRPKGVAIEHRSVAALLAWASSTFTPDQRAGVLASTSICFDLSVFEIFLPLVTGGKVILAENALHLASLGAAGDVTLVNTVPSVLAELLRAGPLPPSVRTVCLAGEALPASLVERVYREPGVREVYNLYGPTEDTTYSTFTLVPRDDARPPSIGRPLDNARAYILDEGLSPSPLGYRGEIYLGGEGLARAYLARPELTADRFVPDPFGAAPGSRLYRTGDLGRRREDGSIEFLGRIDAQVKVRGFRIEPGEIEDALRRHPSIVEAAVVAQREGATESRLVAFVVTKAPRPIAADLRRHLEATIPAAIAPSAFVAVDALPLTPSGKVDRAALAARPIDRDAAGEGEDERPATPLEEIVAGAWAEILKLDKVGVAGNFFDLGGHSLLATRVVTRLRRLTGVDLPLRAIFDAPTVRALARRIDAARRAPSPPIARADADARRELSYAQKRLWFLDRLEPDSAAYNIANAIRIAGPLDPASLAGSLGRIVGRHEALRARFEEGPDGPTQIFEPAGDVALAIDDLEIWPAADREREAAKRAGEEARRPFDLSAGPLLRARLIRISAEDHVLVLVVHHIASDGWSMGVIVSELAVAYAALALGESPRLPELRVQYADWAAWQRGWLEGGEMERQLAWWREELADLPALSLPTDRPRPARPGYAGASLDVRIEKDLADRMARVARAEGATLHMALLAGFAAVLSRWSGQRDFGIGTPVANRTREEAESLIGFFVNSLVVRARIQGTRVPYAELLRGIRESALTAYANQDVPFERVVEAVRPDRDLSRTPLFQVMFILQNAPMEALDLAGVTLAPFRAETATSTFDLTLSLAPDAGALDGFIEYSTEIFDEATIRTLWDHLARLLAAIAADPSADVRTVRLLGDAEIARALDAWSGRGALRESAFPIHERFLARAAAAPESIAAVAGDRRVTYGTLADLSGRLAARLIEASLGPEERVGICAPRSPEMLIAMMAVLRAGGAFVPLDPDHPRDRVDFCLTDSGARLVLATRATASMAEGGGRQVILLDDDRSYTSSPIDRSRDLGAGAIAYVVYTSGTTGRPKGAMIPHGAAAAAYEAWESLYGLGAIRIHLQMAGVAFDVCTGDVIRALGSGGTLVICERERLLDPARLFDLARRERVEFAEFVPAVLRALASHARGRAEKLDSFRIAVVGSDVWSAAEIDEFRAIFGPRTRLANSYGVTEATIDSTCWFLDEGGETLSHPPIGRPLTHTTVYVLDDGLDPVPPGITGGLYLGGPAVGRGYIGRPDLTAERFVPDPFGPPGARLYRTGDRARYLKDGRIAFAGRADDQIKIRGQRIEPGEIESALRSLPEVAACAVVAKRDPLGETRLAAYFVLRDGAAAGLEEIRRGLRAILPEVMLPHAFVALAAMPLTPNGKVDRRRLPEPEWRAAAAYEPPRPGAETAVAAAFEEVLGIEKVGATGDFFGLGGHSLLATRVVSRLRASLAVELPLRAIFEAPVVRDLAARATALAPARVPPPVRRATGEERRRLSYSQRRLWFLDRLEPGTAWYNLPSSVALRGDLDVAALERAIGEVVRRHEALRTRFVEGADGPGQIVDAPARFTLPVDDLAALTDSDRAAECMRLTRGNAGAPFDLATGPLLRARLLRLSPRDHRLLVTLHHISADGWSLGVLIREMGALYGSFAGGGASPLPDLDVQYGDWSAWQRAWLEGGEMDHQLAFWREELAGIETLNLAADRPGPARPTYAGTALPVRVARPLTDRLRKLARAEGATLHIALLAAYAESLGRWSGQKDFAIGVPVANRRTTEAESLIGFFVNTLPVRARLAGGGTTFRELLRRTRDAALGAYANQDVPFERVVEEIQPDRYLGHNPVIQTLFALQNAPVGAVELPGLACEYDEPHTGISRFDLELFFGEADGGLEGTINYRTEIFDRGTVDRFVGDFETLLRLGSAEPDRILADLPSLAPAQLRRVLVEWNADRIAYTDPPIVHALFEREAGRRPDAIAARFGAACMTYGDLNARANRLARFLVRQGLRPGDLVAVCVERSFEMLVALLGVMKSGAAYVPVDPEYPAERIALICEDAGAGVVLTQARLAARLPGGTARAILLDRDWAEIETEGPTDLHVPVSPDALVYAVYTSGSTGRPKGVAMTHRAISNLLSWQRRDSAAAGAPRTLQFASLSFDVSFQEIFSTLTAGGEIVLVTEDERRDTSRLVRILDEQQVERLFVPFVALNQIAETCVTEGLSLSSLREIDTAGEQLKITPALRAFFSRLRGCRLVNHYGPSETHLVTAFELKGPPDAWPELPAIGRAIANAPVYLLDGDGRPVAVGVPGELYVGGAGLARGYHARPDLTAERFIPDPFGAEPGGRLYRTGDLARFRGDAEIEFLGRVDLQIKVRGYRVEPGEIEAVILRHPSVRQAAVAAHDHRGGKRLAAYVVPRPGESVEAGAMRDHIAATLPAFMIPSAIVVMDGPLPASPNGKVDRAALPEPDWIAAAGYVAPRSPEEEIVCGVFAEVLDLPRAGAHDDFFDLGGHSLLATQVVSRVRRAFGVEIPLRALFESPTPAGIAAAALTARRSGASAPPPIARADARARRALSFAQRRLWFLDRLEPGGIAYNLPVAVRIEGDLETAALARALTEIVRRHEALRTRFVEGAEGPEAVVDAADEVTLRAEPVTGSGSAQEAEALRGLKDAARRPFDLARGPMLRWRLQMLGPRAHVLLLVAHHISADGWSMAVLVRELGALYRAFTSGAASPLAELPVQYADWAAWQRAWLAGGEISRQLAYWKVELEGSPRSLELATDRARPSLATWNGATLDVELPAGLRSRLESLARAEGATLHMALLAGYAWALMRHSGQGEVVVGTPVANRRSAEAEDLVGFFVNALAIRVRGTGAATWRELLARVREASLGAYANQDVPFERVVEEIQPERALNRAPLFQTAFALQNARLPEIDLPGLSMTPIEIDTGTAKFDLMLTLGETAEGLSGSFEYNTDLFDRETMKGIAASFRAALEAATAAPASRPGDVVIPIAPEEARAFEALAGAPIAAAGPLLLHAVIEAQAARTPGAPALAIPGGTLTYAELDTAANRLANHLCALGAAPEGRVAVVLERSPRALIATLAVLKSGAAYAPFDPAEPAGRLRFLVEDAGASIVVTDAASAGLFRESKAVVVVALDSDEARIAAAPSTAPTVAVRPGNLAYVVYTSGSTGKPKGVGVEHRQITSYVRAAVERLGIEAGWRFAVVSTPAADLGNTAIYAALATGGCLHMIPPEIAFDAKAIEEYFESYAIDVLKIVPSHLQALMSGAHPERAMPAKLLVLGGEATPGSRLAVFRQLRPGCRVANHYGPTETTVGAIAGGVADLDGGRSALPLGRPLANARALVLDEALRPVPRGVPGEIHLGGGGVARGYLGRSDLTADRFVPDPLSIEPGARMYRTGDRGRWLHDGRLEFLGRTDAQVKVRGYRVETGEIESAIASHPEVRETAVVARPDPISGAKLVAYVVPVPRRARSIDGHARRPLPSGVAVAELNRNETDYIHREIFETRAYVRHGIELRDGDTIFDVGANIGLFSVFASLACAGPRLFVFEPNPHLAPILRANAAAYAPQARVFDVGLAEAERTAAFTFFPGFSLLSGLHADAGTEKEVVRSFIENQGRAGAPGAAALVEAADALLEERFAGRTLEVRLRTLSSVVDEHRVERIHLLKINVEKSELEVLRGIRDEHWERIDQAVVEVDVALSRAPIVALFETHGFDVLVEQDPLLARTELCYVYAVRRGSGRRLAPGAPPSIGARAAEGPFLTVESLRDHVGRTLPGYMVPSAWVLLESLPLTANGKLDRARLPQPVADGGAYVAPKGEMERAVAALWSEALGVDRVGAHDNFFDLGGHSLLLARVHANLRVVLRADIPIVDLFRFPTVASLAARLAGDGRDAGGAAQEAERERGTQRREALRARAGRRPRTAPEKDA